MRRLLFLFPLLVLAGLALLFVAFGLRHDPRVTPMALVGKPVPATPLRPLKGGDLVPLSSEVKGVTVINTFSSTCVPCIEEGPALMALKEEGARIVGVDYKDDPAAARAFLARFGDPFTLVLLDQDGRGGVDLGISGVPETFLVARDGRVRAKYVGALQPGQADEILAANGGP